MSRQESGLVAQFTQRALSIIKTEGLAGLGNRVADRLTRKPIHQSSHVVLLTLDIFPAIPAPKVKVEISQLQPTDDAELEALQDIGLVPSTKAQLVQRLKEGQRCYVAKSDGRVVARIWLVEGEFGDTDLERRCQLAQDEVYLETAFTVPEFRGKGIAPHLAGYSLQDIARARNKTRAFGFIDVRNRASLRSGFTAGFKPVGRIGFIEVFGIRFYYLFGRKALPQTRQRFYFTRM
jgi:GNAT superfamily N-acetyltransferase